MKIKSLGAVLAKRFGIAAAADLVPWHRTLGDVDSPQALADYQAAKRVHKTEWNAAPRGWQLRGRRDLRREAVFRGKATMVSSTPRR